MLSTPVCGVAIKNDVVAPCDAPCLFRDTAVGNTPQEHSGNGIPSNAAFITGLNPLPDKWCAIISGFTNACNIPAIKNPNNIYGDISFTIARRDKKKCDIFMTYKM